jgi:predicted component of type VI protein secretion system
MELSLTWQIGERPYVQTVSEGKPITLGRHSGCDIVLADPEAANRHAVIFVQDEAFHLGNLSRSKQIKLNKGRQWLAYGKSIKLQPGLTFQVGSVEVHVSAIRGPAVAKTAQVEKRLKIRCSVCRREVDFKLKDCPWCGASLAHGLTGY